MPTTLSNIKYSILTVFFLVLAIFNAYYLKNSWLGLGIFGFYTVYYGAELGARMFKNESPIAKILIGAIFIISGIMIVSSIFYYFVPLRQGFFVFLIMIAPAIIYFVRGSKNRTTSSKDESIKKHRIPIWVSATYSAIAILLIIFFNAVFRANIIDATRSPWNIISSEIFILLAISALLISFLAYRGKEKSLFMPAFIIFFFAIISIASIAYPIGYGFDPFIHRATIEHIIREGTISPKPLYYAGQYVLELFLYHGFNLPIEQSDKYILPVLTAISIPLAWLVSFSQFARDKHAAIFSMLAILILPVSSFIATSPQGIANLLIILAIILSVYKPEESQNKYLFFIFLLGIAALSVHPLAGIPIFFYLTLILIKNIHIERENKTCDLARKIAFPIIAVFGAISLPLSFIVNSYFNAQTSGLNFNIISFKRLSENLNLTFFFENRFDPLMDFVYLYGFNTLIIFALLAVAGALLNRKLIRANKTLLMPALGALIIAVNYLIIISAVDFQFLIDYERTDYADRLIPIFIFFLIPYIALFFITLWEKLKSAPVIVAFFALTLIASVIAANFYLTYPRNDQYEKSHGFNVALADFKAAKWINDNGGNEKFIVLSNQNVAAAAVSEYGFKTYYGDIFYYPIPTGEQLYKNFLEMNELPTAQKADEAKKIVGADKLYFVVNDYWWESNRIIETAKRSAISWDEIDNGKIIIFEY